jgi:hypothetical protein
MLQRRQRDGEAAMSKADWHKRSDWYLKAFEAALARHLQAQPDCRPPRTVPRISIEVLDGGCLLYRMPPA